MTNKYVKIRTTGGVSGAPQLEYELARICQEYIEGTWAERQRRYGSENINIHGKLGLIMRIDDKLKRLRKFQENPKVIKEGEGTEGDAWLDLMGYGMIGLAYHRGKWPMTSKFSRVKGLFKTTLLALKEIVRE